MNFNDTESQLEGVREIFAAAEKEDGWNLQEKMLFSYYFIDESVEKLEKLGNKLEADGFEFIDVFELGDEQTEESTGEYLLQIDKIEIHTPESLARRNVEFQKLADDYEIASFDGWEFGEVEEENGEEESKE